MRSKALAHCEPHTHAPWLYGSTCANKLASECDGHTNRKTPFTKPVAANTKGQIPYFMVKSSSLKVRKLANAQQGVNPGGRPCEKNPADPLRATLTEGLFTASRAPCPGNLQTANTTSHRSSRNPRKPSCGPVCQSLSSAPRRSRSRASSCVVLASRRTNSYRRSVRTIVILPNITDSSVNTRICSDCRGGRS